jgi:hypothetical protein
VARSSASLRTTPPPVPPSVNAGRTTSGYPTSLPNATPASISVTTTLRGTGSPIAIIASLKRARSSARTIVSIGVPSNSRP